MARKPQKPQKGQPAIKELYNSVCDIIDYLPSLEVTGDQKSTYVTKSSAGTVIHATQSNSLISVKSNKYYAGSGLILTSGNIFNVEIDPNTMAIVNNKLSCTVEGGGGGGGTTIIASGLQYPNYTALTDYGLSNVANHVASGIGISWVLPVKKNSSACFYSTCGDGYAYGVFASDLDDPNAYRVQMNNGIPVVPSTDGWCRISVFDNGTQSGHCLRFTDKFSENLSWLGSTPLYRFHGYKEFEPDNRTVFLCGGVLSSFEYTGVGDITVDNTNHTISYDGSSGGDVDLSWKLSHPDYEALRNGDYGTVSGQGISFLLPVQSGYPYQFYANHGDNRVFGTFVTSLDNPNFCRVDGIANGVNFTPSADGWMRVSVFDDGYNEG